MKITRKSSAFTLIELLVVISIIAILATLAVPAVFGVMIKGQLIGTLSNARQLHLATQTMSLDTFNAGGDGMEWTYTSTSGTPTPASVQEYFDALTSNNYLSKQDLKKLLTAPGKGPGSADPSASNSCFSFYPVQESSPNDQVLITTANWKGKALQANVSPYSTKGFVYFQKGGGGGSSTRIADASSTNFFPSSATDPSGNTATYNYTPLN
jgi:prepilin-type N-terminal cleavage/methylation domain-containing protein